MLGWAVCALGIGVLASHGVPLLLPPETASAGAEAVVWVALVVPVGLALSRSRPRGLLRMRAIDVASGLVFGVALRLMQGVVAGLDGGVVAWPTALSTDGGLPDSFLADGVAVVVVSPVLEELFFRGVILVCVYAALRPLAGSAAAGVAAVLLSTALFVVAHQLGGTASASDVIVLAFVGLTAGASVMGAGRIGPALVMHVVFNATGVALVAVGTLLA